MALFKVPKPKRVKMGKGDVGYMPSPSTLYIPVSKEILSMLEVGEDVEFDIRGIVRGLESRERDEKEGGMKTTYEVNLELTEVEADENDFEGMEEV
jgi:hypothetical protein